MNRAILIFASLTLGSVPADAKTWAAQFPISNGELSPVFHARNADEALAKAAKFCKQSELCRSQHPDGAIKGYYGDWCGGSQQLVCDHRVPTS